MSTQQPEALRLAEIQSDYSGFTIVETQQAQAELRRLHAEVERLRKLVPDVEFAREAIYGKAKGREA